VVSVMLGDSPCPPPQAPNLKGHRDVWRYAADVLDRPLQRNASQVWILPAKASASCTAVAGPEGRWVSMTCLTARSS